MRIKILQEHLSTYPNPIEMQAGDILLPGESDTLYSDWIKVTTRVGNTGRAPVEYIQSTDATSTGIATCSDTAAELNVAPGDSVDVLKELNGWYWCKNTHNACGWIPVAIGAKIEKCI